MSHKIDSPVTPYVHFSLVLLVTIIYMYMMQASCPYIWSTAVYLCFLCMPLQWHTSLCMCEYQVSVTKAGVMTCSNKQSQGIIVLGHQAICSNRFQVLLYYLVLPGQARSCCDRNLAVLSVCIYTCIIISYSVRNKLLRR
jgi:hypothetical protein